ncbi:hypothetical protein [Pseudarthrobacter sp. SORGH_AS 212]|uniref:hypothetical protein n=1 Tax=Pseudarthrobacter sp. SORGH_AS 212 TaxID=3041777 RepID=UPI0032B772FF
MSSRQTSCSRGVSPYADRSRASSWRVVAGSTVTTICWGSSPVMSRLACRITQPESTSRILVLAVPPGAALACATSAYSTMLNWPGAASSNA